MSTAADPGAWHRTWPLVVAAFLVAATVTAGLGAAWASDLRHPRVTLLGAGNRISVLVTGGGGRLLIATGHDPVAFANALERARYPTTRRLDLLLIAGSGQDLLAAAPVHDDRHVRAVAALGDLPHSPEAAALAPLPPPLPGPRLIRLGDGVTVAVETAAPESDQVQATAWRAIVRRGATSIVVLSDGTAAIRFPPAGPANALVVADDDPAPAVAALAQLPAQVLALAAGGETSGKELRQAASRTLGREAWAVRVHPGEAIPLRFTAGGLEVPREPAQALSPATPNPDPPATAGPG